MRSTSLLAGLALAALPLLPAPALSTETGTAGQPPSAHSLRVAQAQTCPPGTHWVDSSYARGKYREAHCARDDGKD